MRTKRLSIGLRMGLSMLIVAVLAASAWAAPHEKVLYNFGPTKYQAAFPVAGLIFDSSGSLYGTTYAGAHYRSCYGLGCGTVFKLSPTSEGGWKETRLLSFDVSDGLWPFGALIFDAAGNLYSTTYGGKESGEVFELSPREGGGWRETILHTFPSNRRDGSLPASSLIFDGSGNLYGTTTTGAEGSCGPTACGIAFELSPKPGGGWRETVLHMFKSDGKDGFDPQGSLILDASGNLYGTTAGGRIEGCLQAHALCGMVFELIPKTGGGWTEKVLHNFNNKDGAYPTTGLIFDAAGNLYGTTQFGGSGNCNGYGFSGCGTVFELTPKTGGGWTEIVLHDFQGKDGVYPLGGLVFDKAGNLYGTTEFGGSSTCFKNPGCGTVFELTPKAGGGWTETVLHSFSNNGEDGTIPMGGVILDSAGNLYGTTEGGGNGKCWPVLHNTGRGCGTVFEITP